VNSRAPLGLRISAWLAFTAWAITIYYFSSLTGPEIGQFGITVWDKAEHFAAFAAGGVLFALALRWTVAWPSKKLACFAVVTLVMYGAFDEFHQLFTPKRSGADPFDWLADSLGALAGVTLFIVIYARFSRPHQPPQARA
jgi:VanZ family protein